MKKLLRRLLRTVPDAFDAQPVVVVSGLPRSGTSMMMKMLEAGGLEIVQDRVRTADEDNPKGYYEFERVKQLDQGDTAWVADAQGRAVKVISALVQHLPGDYRYSVILMQRDMQEILASQRKMLVNREEETQASDEEMARLFDAHLRNTTAWLTTQANVQVLEINFNELLANPRPRSTKSCSLFRLFWMPTRCTKSSIRSSIEIERKTA